MDTKPTRTFRVKVVTVPPKYMVELGLAKLWFKLAGRVLPATTVLP